jgi:hypothetical protein
VQTAWPVAHEYAPFLHALVGEHTPPSSQSEHIPLWQKRLVPQFVPFVCAIPLSTQTAVPDLQSSVPL